MVVWGYFGLVFAFLATTIGWRLGWIPFPTNQNLGNSGLTARHMAPLPNKQVKANLYFPARDMGVGPTRFQLHGPTWVSPFLRLNRFSLKAVKGRRLASRVRLGHVPSWVDLVIARRSGCLGCGWCSAAREASRSECLHLEWLKFAEIPPSGGRNATLQGPASQKNNGAAGVPSPAQKCSRLPIVCRVKSESQAWNSSASTIGPALTIRLYLGSDLLPWPGPAPP